jgi:hypothetical protein
VLSPSPSEYRLELGLPRSPWLDIHLRLPTKAPPIPPPAPVRGPLGQPESEPADERIAASVPLTIAGSAKRIWYLVDPGNDVVLGLLAAFFIGLVWCVVLLWYLIWALLVVPYRLIRRISRKLPEH